MSILGATADYFYNGTSTAGLVALRAAVSEMYADFLPDNITRPFVVLGEAGTKVLSEVKGASHRRKVLDVSISFDVYARNREESESILEKLETAYLEENPLLSLPNRTHIATTFSNRLCLYDGTAWQGTLELDYRIVKS